MSLFSKLMGIISPDLSPEERDQQALDRRQCPDCHSNKLLLGPRGGAARNVACGSCQSEFNLLLAPDRLFLLDRMGKLSLDRCALYGIPPEEWMKRQREQILA